MEPYNKQRVKKKDKKPLYILLGFLLFFGLFIYLITRPSLLSKAIDQIQVCSNVEDVKIIYDQYKFQLLEKDEEKGIKIVDPQFQDVIRKKLQSFNLDDTQLNECLEWLPPAKTSLNIIVIPDLSRRIIDTNNNPDQIDNDILVLKTIWDSFKKYSMLRQDTKDRLIIDVTDIDQARGQFGKVANQLHFDLSEHKGKSNRLYFTEDKTQQFEKAILEMYQSAEQNPLGADYWYYFGRYLINHLRKPSLYDNYLNKVIIITDGYLEPEDRIADTKFSSKKYSYDYTNLLNQAARNGNILDIINLEKLNILKVNGLDLSDTDVLVCEVQERRFYENTTIPYEGKSDFVILKAYWTDWLNRMGARNVSFIQREQATNLTKDRVEKFIME